MTTLTAFAANPSIVLSNLLVLVGLLAVLGMAISGWPDRHG